MPIAVRKHTKRYGTFCDSCEGYIKRGTEHYTVEVYGDGKTRRYSFCVQCASKGLMAKKLKELEKKYWYLCDYGDKELNNFAPLFHWHETTYEKNYHEHLVQKIRKEMELAKERYELHKKVTGVCIVRRAEFDELDLDCLSAQMREVDPESLFTNSDWVLKYIKGEICL